MRYVLGFDGGGTKTDCVMMNDAGSILARTRSGPSNPARVGLETAIATVLRVTDKALTASGKSSWDIASICGGIAGAGATGTIPLFEQELRKKFGNALVSVNSDLNMALAASGDPPSLAVIAGTGSAIIGRDKAGNLAREGGFGPVLGDPGSAYDIGRRAVIQELRMFDSQKSSPIGKDILALFRCDWTELQDQIRIDADSVLPKIFPIITKAANEGDPSAQSTLRAAAEDLSDLANRVVHALHLLGESFAVAKIGGVFGRSEFFDGPFEANILKFAPHAKIADHPTQIVEFAAHSALKCLEASPVDAGKQLT
jgi:N-acetylglucosamine kinase-like BadF-type ATPase